MTITLLSLTLTVLAADPPLEPRKQNPIAPSLPFLTREEEARLDEIIDRFMKFDIGQLTGEAGKQALRDFLKLGPEAIPALIRGLNRAAELEHSCPVVVIAKKLNRMLMASPDQELLDFARENIAAGVRASRHMGLLQDMRVACMLRRNALAARTPPRPPEPAGPKTPRQMSNAELVQAAGNDNGPRLKGILTELEQRRGTEALAGLSVGATNSDPEIQELSRTLLEKNLGRQPVAVVKQKLTDDNVEIRRAAVRVAVRSPALVGDLIDRLTDSDDEVRQTAHQALVRLNRGNDLGPAADADAAGRQQAQQQWRTWLERLRGR